ncbi:MarR family winged helix-turn-helix transcriptional regulator [Catenisphaera adipataccumulans]|uniref:DNA-binding MarR family transcriptional regulator n=1 Tax=Catenisphaera adipataccumulans TaxID=700500 RepID=A0A7W8FUW6_9FIRM|nr:MarR family transcriptional regulator [Catenisphaera adipataccumulans]MBB5182994.1 DNA-binding MarR family transcriptional regulator [Catenisphaera adipataccumulans]
MDSKTKSDIVHQVRAFNRFYLPAMNLLGNHYLGSEYSASEARVIYEIYEQEGCNAAHISKVMNMDKSYLSRVINRHVKKGYIERRQSQQDSRSYRLYLTEKGKQRAEAFIQASDTEIWQIIGRLTDEELRELEQAMCRIMQLMQKGEDNENRSV